MGGVVDRWSIVVLNSALMGKDQWWNNPYYAIRGIAAKKRMEAGKKQEPFQNVSLWSLRLWYKTDVGAKPLSIFSNRTYPAPTAHARYMRSTNRPTQQLEPAQKFP